MSQVEDKSGFQVETRKFLAQLKDGHSQLVIAYSSEDRFNLWVFKGSILYVNLKF